MAKRNSSLSDRFPHLKLFFFLAVLIAFPLTVWSVQKAPTNLQQEAGVSAEYPPSLWLPAPKNLSSRSYCAIGKSPVSNSWVTFSWSPVPGALDYQLFLKYSYGSWYDYPTQSTSRTSLSLPLKAGQTISWFVDAEGKPIAGYYLTPRPSYNSVIATVQTRTCVNAN